MKMYKMINGEITECEVDPDQVNIMDAAGWLAEKPKSEKKAPEDKKLATKK